MSQVFDNIRNAPHPEEAAERARRPGHKIADVAMGVGGVPELPVAQRPRASRARDKRDQDQVVEIPGSQAWKTARADRRWLPSIRVRWEASRANRLCVFMVRSR